MSVARQLFGTDGIRGAANEHPMTPEVALRLGKAITYVTHQRIGRQARVVIGKDTRLSGYMLETALASGICAMGGRVMLCGPIPTPGVAQLTVSMRCDAGIVITASHNPYGDNGIKFFGGDGYKLADATEADLEALLAGDVLEKKRVTGAKIGGAVRIEDAQGRYVVFCKSTFPAHQTLDGVRIVVDAAHGAAYRVAPTVFEELGATVYPLGVKPNGRNINRTGALHPGGVASEVVKRKAQLGIALDGDADRVIVVDERGETVDGDTIMALCALHMLDKKTLPKKTLVTTVMSNLGLERAITSAGGKLVRTPVGDRYVVERMRKSGYRFGGEQSGHLIFLGPRHHRRRHRGGASAVVDPGRVAKAAQRARRQGDDARPAGAGVREVRSAQAAQADAAHQEGGRCNRKEARQKRPRRHPLERHRAQAARHGRRGQRSHDSQGCERHHRGGKKGSIARGA